MKTSVTLLLTCCMYILLCAMIGCKSPQGNSRDDANRHKFIFDPNDRNVVDPQSARVPTREEIWKLREQSRCEELIEAVDIFLKAKRRDENTKGTFLFLKADCQRQLGEFEEAMITFQTVITDCNNATYLDPNASDRIPVRPECDVGLRLVTERDKCSFPQDSDDYTSLAWKYLDKEKYETAIFMAWQCIRRFRGEAEAQQKAHQAEYGMSLPKLSPEPKKNERILVKYWALYDVGTSCFVLGQAYEYQADDAVKHGEVSRAQMFYEEAIRQYKKAVVEYPSARCFDPEGPWYWSVKDGAEERINRISDRKLKNIAP